jgi:hypothetical protein
MLYLVAVDWTYSFGLRGRKGPGGLELGAHPNPPPKHMSSEGRTTDYNAGNRTWWMEGYGGGRAYRLTSPRPEKEETAKMASELKR